MLFVSPAALAYSSMAENCKYGTLHDELRDHIVVWLRDLSPTASSQLSWCLTLEKAVSTARQSETIKRPQTDLRVGRMDIDTVTKGRGQKPVTPRTLVTQSTHQQSHSHCGIAAHATNVESPLIMPKHNAQPKNSHVTCGKTGHYSKVCRSAKTVHVVETESIDDTRFFLGSVDASLDGLLI